MAGALLLAGASGSLAAPHEMAGQTPNAAYVVDRATIKRSGGVATAWIMHVFRDEKRFDAAYAMEQAEVDCEGDRVRTLYIVAYTADGAKKGEQGSPKGWRPVIPGTANAMTAKAVCAITPEAEAIVSSEDSTLAVVRSVRDLRGWD